MLNRPSAAPQRPSMASQPVGPASNAPKRTGTGSLQPIAPQGRGHFMPNAINKGEETGLNPRWIQDLILKTLYYKDNLSGFQIADNVRLPFVGIVDGILNGLKRDKLIEVPASAGGFGEGAYQYAITSGGQLRAREAMERSQYVGPAPVPIEVYNDSIRRQSMGRPTVTQRQLRVLLSQLVVSDKIFNRVGPAINSGTSMFMYGPPGNGKTTVARSIGGMILTEDMYIPYAIDIAGVVVKLHDSVNHQLAKDEDVDATAGFPARARTKPPPITMEQP